MKLEIEILKCYISNLLSDCTVRHFIVDNAGEVTFRAGKTALSGDLGESAHYVTLGRVCGENVVVVVESVIVAVVDSIVP